MNKINKYIFHPKQLLLAMMNKNYFSFIPDEMFLKIDYRLNFNKKLDLNNPKTYNEKIQWLKLNDRKEVYTKMVDKYEAKEYVANIIGNKYIIPTIGIYEKFDDIDFDNLPDKFVIKCTHDSGGIIICKDKSKLDVKSAKRRINKYLKRNYFYKYREWPYKNVKPRIIIEKYMEDKNSSSMRDYKFFCFNGEPKVMYISEGLENHSTASMSFFDMDFNLINCKRSDYKLLNYIPEKPKTFEQMKKFAAILSKNIPHLRVDFYEIDGHLYFGELTFSTCSGLIPFETEEWNLKFGEMLDLSMVKKNEK